MITENIVFKKSTVDLDGSLLYNKQYGTYKIIQRYRFEGNTSRNHSTNEGHSGHLSRYGLYS